MTMKKLLERIDSIERKQTTTLTEGVGQGVAEGYNDISVGDYVSYDDGPGTDRWEVVSIEGNRVELRNDQGGTTFADINDVLKEQGVSEGYSLKKTNVSKYMEPGDTDEYTQDINIKDTDYEIINNKTGQVVGTASWTTNDYFGPGALKITMKNGATRWLDIYTSERGNPQTAFNRFVKDPKTAKKYKEQGVAEGKTVKESKAKPDYIDLDGDGNRKETMKKAAADKKHHKKPVQENRPPMDQPPTGTKGRAPVGPGGDPEKSKGSRPDPYSKAAKKPIKEPIKESWTDFDDAKRAHEKAGSTVTGRPEDYTVTMADGTRKRFITKDGRRKLETLPPVAARRDDDEDDAPAKKTAKSADKKAAPAKEGGKKRGRPAGSKNKKKVSEMNESEFHQFMRGVMLIEEKMSPEQKAEKERIVKGMKKSSKDLKKRYGARWQDVMHATATKKVMESFGVNTENLLLERARALKGTFWSGFKGGFLPQRYSDVAGMGNKSTKGKVVNRPHNLGAHAGEVANTAAKVAAGAGLMYGAQKLFGGDNDSGGTRGTTTPVVPPTPASTTGSGQMYQIGKGDTLSQIASKRGVSVKDLLAANPEITNPDRIRTGQEIRLPGAPAAQSTPPRTEPGRSYSPQAFQGTTTPPAPTVVPGSTSSSTSTSSKPADIYAGGVGTVANTQANIDSGYFKDSPESRLAAQRSIASPAGMPNEPGSGPGQMLGKMVDNPVPPIPPVPQERAEKYTPGPSSTDYLATQRAANKPEETKSEKTENKSMKPRHGTEPLNELDEDLAMIKRLSGLK